MTTTMYEKKTTYVLSVEYNHFNFKILFGNATFY